MERSARSLLMVFALVAGASWSEAAEPETAAPSTRERVISPRVAGMLAAAVPKYAPSRPAPSPAPSSSSATEVETAEASPVRPASSERLTPANGIVRLPEYVVRERKPAKLPDPEEVMARQQLERIAMQRHLGDEQGLERALSMLTPVHLWRKIPVLGKFPLVSFETNEQRAMRMDYDAKIKARWDALSGLMSPELKPAPKPQPPEESR